MDGGGHLGPLSYVYDCRQRAIFNQPAHELGRLAALERCGVLSQWQERVANVGVWVVASRRFLQTLTRMHRRVSVACAIATTLLAHACGCECVGARLCFCL